MNNLDTIAGLRISLASPEQIRAWSCGQVTKPDTINYQTNKPEKDGLFCERIFGPMQDWTCACGKYAHERTPGFVCDKCGVEVTVSRVRRERMGHIELVVPVVHSWFARGAPSILAMLLDLSPRHLASILAYSGYLITEINERKRKKALIHSGEGNEGDQELHQLLAHLSLGAFLDEAHYRSLAILYGDCFRAQTGGEVIRRQLDALDLPALSTSLRQMIREGGGNQKKAIKRLHLVEAFRASGIKPSWAVLDIIPVLPPDLRPLVHLGGGRLAASDLNTLYEWVIHRNARVQRFINHGAPDAIVNYEKRLLQDACDALFDKARRKRPMIGARKQPLKSLTDTLKGKQGRFRHNLLGKRVDYSGRSVICVGLDLHLHECGLPKKIALELFKPFVIRKLIDRHFAGTPRQAKRMVERRDPCVWDQLAECMHEKVVLLNRAPTLHRLSIQAFEAKLVEGDAIRLHPLVCSAFNADFDGDQMAVHLPLSDEAQAEARRLMLSVKNMRSPATGDPAISLSQEIVLGGFYLTEDRPSPKQAGRVFVDANEARLAYEQGVIDVHTHIIIRIPDQQIYDTPPPAPASTPRRGRIETTVGRLIFNELLPASLRYRNYAMTKEGLKQLLIESLTLDGEDATARLADAIKHLGYHYATRSGTSFGMSDMQEPPEKQELVAEGQTRSQEIHALFQEGTITQEERDRQAIALWTDITERISAKLVNHLDPFGTLLQAGVLLNEHQVDVLLATGITAIRVRSPFTCQADYGICCRCYSNDLSTGKLVKRGVAVGVIAGQSIGEPGTQLTMRTFHSGGIANAQGDITQGLPRVSELFEARIPKGVALLAEIDGEVQIEKHVDTGKTVIRIVGNDASVPIANQYKEYEMVPGQSLLVENGQTVTIGMPLTTGARNPRQILDLQGREETARYMINEVQSVYRATGVYISDKHVEVIVRQMLRSVQVSEPGDTVLLPGDLIDGFSFTDANASILAQGGEPAQAYPVLLGLTRTALNTASWVAAASFQETSKVLTQAAIRRQVDSLRGYKERVVLGARIPRSIV